MLLSLIISLLSCVAAIPVAEDMPEWNKAIEKAHPRLLMNDAEMVTLRKNIRRNKDVKLLHNSIVAHADECAA